MVGSPDTILHHVEQYTLQAGVSYFVASFQWGSQVTTCLNLVLDGRRGWRVPTYPEVASLALDGDTPPLPSGHPFALGAAPHFWTQTLYTDNPTILVGWFDNAAFFISQQPKTDSYRVMCVRAPTGPER